MRNIDKNAFATLMNRIAAVALPLPVLNLFYVAAKNNVEGGTHAIIWVWLYIFVFSLGLPYFTVRAALRIWRGNLEGFRFMRAFSILGIGFLMVSEIIGILYPEAFCSEAGDGCVGERNYALVGVHSAIFLFFLIISCLRLRQATSLPRIKKS